jgi:hypothetical protein
MMRTIKHLFILITILLGTDAQAADKQIGSFAQQEVEGYIQVTIEYRSMFPGNLQVRDEVCKQARSIECEKAKIIINSEACNQSSSLNECKEWRDLLESSFCVEGLIFDGRVQSGEKIDVWICLSSTGFGNVSARDTKNGWVWTNYPLLNKNSSISYP